MRRMELVTALAVLAGVVGGAGCPGPIGPSANTNSGVPANTNRNSGANGNLNQNGSPGDTTARVIAGLEFFSMHGCGACHCNNAEGGCNLNAPSIIGVSQDSVNRNLRFAQTAGERPNEDDPVESHPLKLPGARDEEIANVTLYLGSLDPRTPLTGESAITRGYNIYVRGGCVACHLPSAQGLTQGGFGNPIQGTEADNIYFALGGGTLCHPLQNPRPNIPPQVSCPINIGDPTQPGTFANNETVMALTDHPPPDTDDDRTLLSYFLQFIAPPPSGGVVDPCENRSGEICTVAGNGISGFTGDDKAATETLFYNPLSLELTDWNDDGTLDLGVVDWNNHRVRVIYLDKETPNAEGVMIRDRVISLAGTGKVTGDDAINHCTDLAFDANGSLVMANWHNQNMYRYPKGLRSGGDRDQLAGLCDLECGGNDTGPNRVGDTKLSLPVSLAIRPDDGRIYVAEGGCSRIRVLTVMGARQRLQPTNCITAINFYPDGTLETIAGHSGMNGYSGDGGPAKDAIFNIDNTPLMPNMGLALSKENPPAELYVADSKNHCIRAINLLADPPTIRLFAGTPTMSGFKDGAALGEAQFNFPSNVQVDDQNNVYVADALNHAIRRIDRQGNVTTLAGTGVLGFNGDNQPATMAQLNYPNGVAIHPDGRVFIADTNNNRVRVIIP
ncbi:MAG TPA: hypothetical protein VGM03_01315 [Phycisphaerae bacterium]